MPSLPSRRTVDGKPLVDVLALGQLDGSAQVARAERLDDELMDLLTRRTLQERPLWPESLVLAAGRMNQRVSAVRIKGIERASPHKNLVNMAGRQESIEQTNKNKKKKEEK